MSSYYLLTTCYLSSNEAGALHISSQKFPNLESLNFFLSSSLFILQKIKYIGLKNYATKTYISEFTFKIVNVF